MPDGKVPGLMSAWLVHTAGRRVPPGTGWPEDPATARTPVAAGRGQVAELAASAGSLA